MTTLVHSYAYSISVTGCVDLVLFMCCLPCFWALSVMFSLFLGVHVSENLG